MKNMKWLATALLATVVLAGCGASKPAAETKNNTTAAAEQNTAAEKTTNDAGGAQEDDLARIQASGVIRVGTEGTFSPRTYHDESDKLVGYDVEVAAAIAEKLGVKAEFIETNWDSIVAGMDADKFDIIASDMTPTEERREKFDFSDSYSFIHRQLVVHKDNDTIKTFEDLKGHTVATEVSSTSASIAERYGASVTPVQGAESANEMVLSHRSDAMILPETTIATMLKVNPDLKLKAVDTLSETEEAAIPVRKGQTRLLEAINKALAELESEGKLTEISNKYFNVDVSSDSEKK
jgi:cystine transport system substrate-binding protein